MRGCNRAQISKKQRAFIDDLLTTKRTIRGLMVQHHVSMAWMAQWLTNLYFRRRLRRMCAVLGRLRELELALAGTQSAELLHKATKNKNILSNASQTRAAESNVKLSRWAPGARRRRSSRAAAPSSLAHPDLSHEQAEQLLIEVENQSKEAERGQASSKRA